MAKKSAKRRLNTKVKRAVRKTMAALLMVSAIAVAAIPVEQMEAVGSTMTSTGMSIEDNRGERYHYAVEDDREGGVDVTISNSDGSQTIFVEHDSKSSEKSGNAKYYYAINDQALSKYHRDESISGVEKALTVRQASDGNYYLRWQFKFYKTGAGGVICEYNSQFPESEVHLNYSMPTNYVIVSTEQYNTFTTDIAGINWSYTYADFESDYSNNEIIVSSGDGKILSKYFPTEFNNKLTDYKKYYTYKQAKAQYDADVIKYNQNQIPTMPVEPDIVQKPTDLTCKPGNLEENDKFRLYCDLRKMDGAVASNSVGSINKVNGGEWALVRCYDQATNEDTTETIYMIRNIDANGVIYPDFVDDNGFMIKDKSTTKIIAIGDYAFAGVRSIVKLVLPTEITAIGDYAFADSFIQDITLTSIDTVGNAAFKNCKQLTNLNFGSAVLTTIGAEAFYGTSITSLTLPYGVSTIHAGAFANCTNLNTIDLSQITSECNIKEAAFYDCVSLNNIIFPDGVTNKSIKSLGKACLGVSTSNVAMSVTLPGNLTSLPDSLFVGRSRLESVVFPKDMGCVSDAQIPDTLFMGCSNLQHVTFPEEAIYAYYEAQTDSDTKEKYATLFLDVTNPNFRVYGPAYSTGIQKSEPRKSTWFAITMVNDYVPYVFEQNGVEYYEVRIGECVYAAGSDGVLISCEPIDENSTDPIDLVIPRSVGQNTVMSIGDKCLTNKKLRDRIRSITIEDNTITNIGPYVFKDLQNLEWIEIGNSVTNISEGAFAGCEKLSEVTFHSLGNDYGKLTIGANAFTTGATNAPMVFHGDIQEGYAPFDYAMNPSNHTDKNGTRVLYQSLDPSLLTVILDENTNLVTLVDYPKINMLDLDHASYLNEREMQIYSQYSGSNYQDKRNRFYLEWNKSGADSNSRAALMKNPELYGPWITPEAVKAMNADEEPYHSLTVATSTGDDTTRSEHQLIRQLENVFTEPLTVFASSVGNTIPAYFSQEPYKYSILNNYKQVNPYANGLSENDTKPDISQCDWLTNNAQELAWIDNCLNLMIPAGIDSIDVLTYVNGPEDGINKNLHNIATYLRDNSIISTDEYNMYTKNVNTEEGYSCDKCKYQSEGYSYQKYATPGLFSGYYVDGNETADQYKRGNDYLQTITMTDVQYLPENAFESCDNLKVVTLGQALNKMESLPFKDCNNLTTINGNDNFIVNAGIVYDTLNNGDGTNNIVECLPARGWTFGDNNVGTDSTPGEKELIANTSSLSPSAFEDCKNIRSIDLSGSTISSIPEKCFEHIEDLGFVYLPETIRNIKSEAFLFDKKATISIPGVEVNIIRDAFTHGPKAKKIADQQDGAVTFLTYEDSAPAEYADYYDINLQIVGKVWAVTFIDYEGNKIGESVSISDGDTLKDTQIPDAPDRPGYTFDKWTSNQVNAINSAITQNTQFVAKYNEVGIHDGYFHVTFTDGVDGTQIGDIVKVLPGQAATPPTPPEHIDYTFSKWNSEDYKTVNEDLNIIALYSKVGTHEGYYRVTFIDGVNGSTISTVNVAPGASATAPTAPTHTGYTFSSWNPSTFSNVTADMTVIGVYTNNTTGQSMPNNNQNNTTGQSTSNNNQNNTDSNQGTNQNTTDTATTTSAKNRVTVENGAGSGEYTTGETVFITANPAPEGQVFNGWTTSSSGVKMVNATLSSTTFAMPANNVTVTATYKAISQTSDNNANSSADGTTSTRPNYVTVTDSNSNSQSEQADDTNAQVVVSKPGISNIDMATAQVNGSPDSFVIKVSETNSATDAVRNALTNRFGSLDNVAYWACDISLYDATGNTKIADTTGLTVDITLPIPDELRAYGGNNKVGAIADGSVENLTPKFNTINGVPCVTFTASHFSPYTIYADINNLDAGQMLDATPKTGDPIHPKWFLSIGLACISILLFMKKDRRIKRLA